MISTKLVENDVFIPEIAKLIDEGHTVTIQVKGYSMRPFVEHERDKAVLGACRNPQVGDAILARVYEGNYVLHRVISRVGENLTLMGDGNVKGTEHCNVRDVIGKVTAFIRKNKEDSTDGVKWKVYSFLWVRLLPVRRYLLAFYRLIWLRLF